MNKRRKKSKGIFEYEENSDHVVLYYYTRRGGLPHKSLVEVFARRARALCAGNAKYNNNNNNRHDRNFPETHPARYYRKYRTVKVRGTVYNTHAHSLFALTRYV